MTTIMLPANTADRLMSARLVTPNGCWEWAKCRRNGYGRVYIGKRLNSVHRVAAALWLGLDLLDLAVVVCHRCDNPPCFNPDHLFLGDAFDNMRDASTKGRLRGSVGIRPTTYARVRACVTCGEQYMPDPSHRGRSVVCSPPCLAAYRSAVMRGKGRRLDDARIADAKRLIDEGAKYRDVGALFGVSGSTIHRYINGRRPAA
jgi:hypothetical protein